MSESGLDGLVKLITEYGAELHVEYCLQEQEFRITLDNYIEDVTTVCYDKDFYKAIDKVSTHIYNWPTK